MANEDVKYQHVTFNVTNAQAGQTIWIELQQQTPQVAFSTGPNFESSGGVQVSLSGGGNLPLTSFNANAREVKVNTQSSGGGGSALQFSVDLYLVAQLNTQMFSLRSRSDPGVQITAKVGNAQPLVVNQNFTPFYWNPQ
ncbi:hypothetical protein D7S89_15890 [Trinickia fusca]|uniref:Uncharacterized protein n=2 Tax=Trinickia fusca TaxID=2419777 RepID=A0A494X9L6_9BURK|nr:hypothetical protein D7S89_15890 [Trinickia fusca]